MLYKVTGTIKGLIIEEIECYCCGNYYEKEFRDTVDIDEVMEAYSGSEAIQQVLFENDWREYEWLDGPEVAELPADQLLLRMGDPMLPGLGAFLNDR